MEIGDDKPLASDKLGEIPDFSDPQSVSNAAADQSNMLFKTFLTLNELA